MNAFKTRKPVTNDMNILMCPQLRNIYTTTFVL